MAAKRRPGQPPPFLEEESAPLFARRLASLLLALFVAATFAAALIHVPETVTSDFVLRPVHGASPLRASREGWVDQVQVVEGQPVEAGQALFVIRSEAVGERSAELLALETTRRGAEESLFLERQRFAGESRAASEQTRQLEERLLSLERSAELKGDELALKLDVAARSDSLARQGLTNKNEQAARQIAVKEARIGVEAIQAERSAAAAERERLRHEHEAREAEHREAERARREEVERAEIAIAALREQLAQSLGSKLTVATPCAGTVLRLSIQAPGSFVAAGEVLGEVACAGEPLEAELVLAHADVALLEPGQGVKLLYDAFPYQRHGVRYANLRWVSPASVEIDGQRVFRARAELADSAIVVKGRPRPLRPGMGGTAKVVVGRRSLLSFALEPLRRLRESLADAPPEAPLPARAPSGA